MAALYLNMLINMCNSGIFEAMTTLTWAGFHTFGGRVCADFHTVEARS